MTATTSLPVTIITIVIITVIIISVFINGLVMIYDYLIANTLLMVTNVTLF